MSLLCTPEQTEHPVLSSSSVAGEPWQQVLSTTGWQRALDGRCLFRRAVLRRLANLQAGQLTVVDRSGAHEFGQVGASGPAATITVHDRRFFRAVVLGGSLGAAEAYIRRYWDSTDLTAAMRVLAQNTEVLAGVERGATQLLAPFRSAVNWLRRNTRAGSQRNIAAHYDLSNDFFALMLDPTMTYSSGVFPSPSSTLEAASIEKYDRICRKLQLTPQDHVLEIGTGWGGFAEHAARRYGCRVTTTTISDQQHAYASRRFRDGALQNRVQLLKRDDRFIRTWHYYLCYCEAGFRERQIGVSQILLTKPACRRAPILDRFMQLSRSTKIKQKTGSPRELVQSFQSSVGSYLV